MLVDEFIEKVADGTLKDKDIISFFRNDHKDQVESVAFDMWAYSVSLQEPNTPNNRRAIERIDAAVQLIEKHFGFSLFSNPQSEQAAPEPQQGTSRRKGRPQKAFKDFMIDDPDGSKLQKIHTLMKGQKRKAAALIILASIKKGWISKPTFPQVKDEFGDIGVQQGFTRYLNEGMFSKEELEGAINNLN